MMNYDDFYIIILEQKSLKVYSFKHILFLHCRFKHSLMTWGDKFTQQEVDDAFTEFRIEDGQIDAAHLKGLMVAKKDAE